MHAEGKPRSEPSLAARPLAALTRWTNRRPWPTIVTAFALGVLAIVYSATQLTFRTSRLDLLNPKSGYNKLWIDYINEFGDEDDVVVVVEGDHRDQVAPVLARMAELLSA